MSGRRLRQAALALAGLALAAPLAAQPLSPDAGPFKAEGSWTDQDKHVGQWHAEGTLAAGRFSGSLVLEMLGVTRMVTLRPERASLRGGACVLYGDEGRNRVELRGGCGDDGSIGPGTLSGRFDGHGLRGSFRGTVATGATAATPPPAALPRRRR